MYQKVLIYVLLLFLSACSFPKKSQMVVSNQFDNMEIYLLIGQSNMAGRAEIELQDQDTLERVFLYTGLSDNEWEKAANPLNKYSSIRKNLPMQRLGPGYTFARETAKAHSENKIGLVVNAKGGTSISLWKPGSEFYNEAVSRTKNAMKFGVLKGIVWHQGESDASKYDSYLPKIVELIESLRVDFNMPDLPVVVGQLSEDKDSRIDFNKMILRLPKEIDNVEVVSTENTSTFDGTHFNSASQRLLGERCAKAMTRIQKSNYKILPFGVGGQMKMLYDRRQRPQSVYLNGKVHLVINAGGEKGAPAKSKTKPMVLSYDLANGKFSEIITIGPAKSDHHYCPVIWSDKEDYLHILYGCHKTPGTHLISKNRNYIGTSLDDWTEGPQIAPSISYPTFYKVLEDKEIMYYRTAGHISSWTYRISDDAGKTWTGPEKDVTDLDSKGSFEWSSYQCKLPSKDGRYLHVVFTAYDDNRQREPERYYNPRYKKAVSNEWKYNLYYVKIDLQIDEVYNFNGEKMTTPIDLDQANEKCIIWDTEGRGAGVPPDIVLDKNDEPAFLHVLSEESTEKHNYYFVHRAKGRWKKTVITPSNHQWNSCHVNLDKNGVYHAYLVVGGQYVYTEWGEGRSEGNQFKKGKTNYLKTGGYMDKHGGGRIEEWISTDNGSSWKKLQELTPDPEKYPGWKFNNIQAITNPDGSVVEGMLLFYGWKDKNAPEAKAFLLII